MYYKKEGHPEVGDIVLCTVKNILTHSVFVTMDEYTNLEGMIHISEISPGRIRNLRDFVKEGKRIVCKVLNINHEKGHIDLSLRRVGTSFMIQKLTQFKQEEKAEKFLEVVGKSLQVDLKTMYKKVGNKAIEEYGGLYSFFQQAISDKKIIFDICGDEKLTDSLFEFVKDKIKPPEVNISGVLKITSYEENGIETIKTVLEKHSKEEGTTIQYMGAPKYKLEIISKDYKTAENILKKIIKGLTKDLEKHKCEFVFERRKNE